MRRYVLVGMLFVLLIAGTPSVDARRCDNQAVAGDFVRFLNVIKVFDTNAEKWHAIARWFRARYSDCEETTSIQRPDIKIPVLSLKSEDYGKQPLIGPLTIPDGYYRVRVVTDGSFDTQFETAEGKCAATSMFNIGEGEASQGYELFFDAEGCQVFITVSDVTADWTLQFYATGRDDAVNYSTEYSSDALGLAPLIGPIQFGKGYYRAVMTTEGYLRMEILGFGSSCGEKHYRTLFRLTPGEGNEGAEALVPSENCVAYFVFSSVSEPWTLTFEPLQ